MKLITSLVATLIATTTLPACKLIGSASTKSSTASTESSTASPTDDGKLPQPLRNMQAFRVKIEELVGRYEAGFASGTMSDKSSIVQLRVRIRDYFKEAVQGGSTECMPCRNHKMFPELVAAYGTMDEKTTAMEKQYMSCTNGFKLSSGEVVKPSVEWSLDDLKGMESKAVHNKQRCWSDKDPEKFH